MLEKIGLPPKPSLRGNTWVVDASHCQGCSSQFTFVNRKHHCRRCGGLFCGSCTQQRMVLRGQGDSPVRICEPCKRLEEAARFEMRYGHKSRAGRGGSKLTSMHEDDVVQQVLGSEHSKSLSSKLAFYGDGRISSEQAKSSASSSSSEVVSSRDSGADVGIKRQHDESLDALTEGSNVTPDELRLQASEEKKKHRTLKLEGKAEEALKAFKRAKELEKQAGALEMQLRKVRRKALSSSSSHIPEPSGVNDGSNSGAADNRIPPTKSKYKDDIASELRDLGWSDLDLQESEKKPAKLTLEGELYALIGDIAQKPRTEGKVDGADRSHVIAHKKKALELKREGKLAEAKEELKKAKVLEKRIEEQELLGDDEESDDELSLLIRNMDGAKDAELTDRYNIPQTFDFDPVGGIPDDVGLDNLDVTEDDMNDPEIAAHLRSLGWTAETTYAADLGSQPSAVNTEAVLREIQSLKKEALSQKRAGNTEEALALFKKANLLEKDLPSSDSQVPNINEINDSSQKSSSKNRSVIQKELLGLKKQARALRMEGKLDESEELLKKGKVLEEQLQEVESTTKVTPISTNSKVFDSAMTANVADEGEVNDQDLNDPTYLLLLKNLGWEDDQNDDIAHISKDEKNVATTSNNYSVTQASSNVSPNVPKKSKGEIQRELLGLKRKSRTLRQQGQTEEAEEILKMSKVLEEQLAEFETPLHKDILAEPSLPVPITDLDSRVLLPPKAPEEIIGGSETPNTNNEASEAHAPQIGGNSMEEVIMAHKRRALALKREGKIAEAKEELRQAKLLEKQLQENSQTSPSNLPGVDVSSKEESSPSAILKSLSPDGAKDSSPDSAPKSISSRERFKLQREALNHKRQSLKLRREGKTAEADAEFELAKAIEAQLEESDMQDPKRALAEPVDEVMVEDFLDPQLFSALKAIGIKDSSSTSQGPQTFEAKPMSSNKIDNSREERMQLEEQIKGEKLKALNLKKAGKQSEALDALRRAKLYEKNLNTLTA